MKQPSSITVEVYIKDGRFRSNLNTLKDIINAFEGQTVSVTFKKKMNQRSLQQNKYYWGAIVPIWRNAFKEEWGELWDASQVHKFLKEHLNYVEKVIPETGEIIRLPKSTTENTIQHQQDYHQKCIDLAKDFFNIDIPPPKAKTTLKFD